MSMWGGAEAGDNKKIIRYTDMDLALHSPTPVTLTKEVCFVIRWLQI